MKRGIQYSEESEQRVPRRLLGGVNHVPVKVLSSTVVVASGEDLRHSDTPRAHVAGCVEFRNNSDSSETCVADNILIGLPFGHEAHLYLVNRVHVFQAVGALRKIGKDV